MVILRTVSLPVFAASHLEYMCCLRDKGMRQHLHHRRAARLWRTLVGVRWERWQGSIAGFYFQRVTLPLRWWVACGQPEQFRPQLPWWQPFVFAWLRGTRWLR